MGMETLHQLPVKLNSTFGSGASGIDSAFASNCGTIATSVAINSIDVIFVLIGETCF